jgi:hypothetical protein
VALQVVQDLGDEQRVALCAVQHLGDEPVRRVGQHGGGEIPHVAVREGGDRDRGRGGFERRDDPGEIFVEPGVDLPVRGDEQHRYVPRMPGDEFQHQGVRRAAGMQVLQHHHERAGPGESVQHLGDGVEQRETLDHRAGLGRGRGMKPERGQPVREPVDDLVAARARGPTQHLHPRPVRGLADAVPARTPQHPDP